MNISFKYFDFEKIAYTLIEPIAGSVISGIIGAGAGYIHGKVGKPKEISKKVKAAIAASPIVPAVTAAGLFTQLGGPKLEAASIRTYPATSILSGGAVGYLLGRKLAGKHPVNK